MTMRLPSSWEDVGFPEFARVIESACEPALARPVLDVIRDAGLRWDLAQHATHTARTPAQLDDVSLSRLNSSLKKHESVTIALLMRELAQTDWREVAVLASFLGALPGIQSQGEPCIPGWYDQEIELIATLAADGPWAHVAPASWEVVARILGLAREVLLSRFVAPTIARDANDMVRFATFQSSFFGSTYIPVAREIAVRLLETADLTPPSAAARLADSLRATDGLLQHWFQALDRLVALGRRRSDGLPIRTELVSTVLGLLSPDDVLRELQLPPVLTDDEALLRLTHTREKASQLSLRDHPVIEGAVGRYLVLPRRVTTDLHDTLDRAVTQLLNMSSTHLGTYPDKRASSLDDVISRSVQKLMPGAEIFTGDTWIIDDVAYERDVVVFFDDVALCIETKAPRIDPFPRAGRRDVVKVLRDDVAEGVRQSTLIADALERGDATHQGLAWSPHVRRAYRMVATFNPWWGVETDARALVRMAVYPHPDSAMLTSADKFICFERIFTEPADFIAYLDHRLDHQRRLTVRVADEFELIGAFFDNSSWEWAQRRPLDEDIVIKPAFQKDVTRAIAASYEGRQDGTLAREDMPLFSHQLVVLRTQRPEAWLVAYSAIARLPLSIQAWITHEAHKFSTSLRRPATRVVHLEPRECHMLLVASLEHLPGNAWRNHVRAASSHACSLVLETSTGTVHAIKGLDDENPWMSAALAARSQSS